MPEVVSHRWKVKSTRMEGKSKKNGKKKENIELE
jgi:hypothetical protein